MGRRQGNALEVRPHELHVGMTQNVCHPSVDRGALTINGWRLRDHHFNRTSQQVLADLDYDFEGFLDLY